MSFIKFLSDCFSLSGVGGLGLAAPNVPEAPACFPSITVGAIDGLPHGTFSSMRCPVSGSSISYTFLRVEKKPVSKTVKMVLNPNEIFL